MSKDFYQLMNDMLAEVPSRYDKRESSMIYNALAPCAMALSKFYTAIENIENETYPDTASVENLERWAMFSGVQRHQATYAVVRGEANIYPSVGDRFYLGNYNYVVTALSETQYQFTLRCEQSGTGGNQSGDLTPVGYIDGLEEARIISIDAPARDIEDRDSLYSRYQESFSQKAFGGNYADYKEHVLGLDGVGGVKVKRGESPGEVDVIIVDAYYGVPSQTLVDAVQMDLQPVSEGGQPTIETSGIGHAPIWHIVTVSPVVAVSVSVSAVLTIETGADSQSVIEAANTVINTYVGEIAATWQNASSLTVYRMEIGSRILDIAGVIDVNDIAINGESANLVVSDDKTVAPGSNTITTTEAT